MGSRKKGPSRSIDVFYAMAIDANGRQTFFNQLNELPALLGRKN